MFSSGAPPYGTINTHHQVLAFPGQARPGRSQLRKTRSARCHRPGAYPGAHRSHIDFFLAHADKLAERVAYYSEKHLEMRERAISANELLSLLPKPARWKRKSILMPGLTGTSPKRSPLCPVCTAAASSRMPRASCGRTCPIGRTGKKVAKRRGDLDSLEEATIPPSTKGLSLSNWTASICARPLCGGSVYTGQSWKWVNYPVRYSRYAGAAAHRAWVGRAQSEVGRTQTRS